jgi:hypothetical protein
MKIKSMKFLALLTLIAAFPLASRAEKAEKLDVPGLFAIESPIEGVRWKKMESRNKKNNKEEPEDRWSCICGEKSSGEYVILHVWKYENFSEESRRDLAENELKLLQTIFTDPDHEILGSKMEPPATEIANHFLASVRAKNKKTEKIQCAGVLTLLGEYTCQFQLYSKSEDRYKGFVEKIVRRFEEKESAEHELFNVPGEFSVRAPEQGYKWKKASEQSQGGVKAVVYSCTKEGSKNAVVLSVQKLEASLDSYRRTQLKASVNGMGSSLRQQTGKNPNIKLPSLNSPIPDRVTWYGDAEVGENDHLYFHSACVFGKNVYGINVCTRSDKDSLAWLRRILDSFKEVPRDEKNRFVESGLFSIGLPGEGYKWEKSPQQGLTAYLCKKEGSEVQAILNFIEKPIADKESKEKLLDHFIKFRKEQLAKDRSTIVDFQEPFKEWNYPEINHYSFKTKSASGKPITISCIALFLNHTYILEVTGPEKDNPKFVADQLINSLRELKDSKEAIEKSKD